MGDKIVVIGDEDLCTGFGLAGITQGYETSDPAEAERLVSEFAEREDVGMVIIFDSLAAGFSPKMKARLQQITKPVMITVPGKMGADAQAESLSEMIKKAIGVELK
ncbi:MAG: V-type ATP synthase subunit F [Candidatus Micrarchaeia archaeon]|jgi:V/A-type H+-transporting ATPase subunit F